MSTDPNKLTDRIAKKLGQDERLNAVQKARKVDMEGLIDDIARGLNKPFEEEYHGRDCVFEILVKINDLIRLGAHEEINEALDLKAYNELQEMPALSACFRCLANAVTQTGSLTLLDLPGFNEASVSEDLKLVVQEQLEKASAILVILDYTQMNTEASAEFKEFLDAVSDIMQDRIFVVVNKFDQRTSRDPDPSEQKSHISDVIMQGKADPDHIYLVSAHHAYLSSRALDALSHGGCLPDADAEPWVTDFGRLVFPFDETKLEVPDEVRKAAESVWERSGFESLLNNVNAGSKVPLLAG